MKYIIKYNNFNESRGISDSSERITDSIWNDIESDVINFKKISKKFTFNEIDFKIKNLEIDVIISKGVENLCNSILDLKKSNIEDKYIKNVKITFSITYNSLCDPFLYYIKSIVFHEISHLFNHYNLKINNKFRPESFSIGSIIPQLRINIKTEYVKYILDILYYSLSHELSAQLHQYYMYKKDDIEYKKIYDIKKFISNLNIKKLNDKEDTELTYIKNNILESIKYYTTNKNYIKYISNSIWIKDNNQFLIELSKLMNKKIKWIDKKIKLIDSKIIDYSETFTYYGELDDYKYLEFYNFIKENLNNCPIIDNI